MDITIYQPFISRKLLLLAKLITPLTFKICPHPFTLCRPCVSAILLKYWMYVKLSVLKMTVQLTKNMARYKKISGWFLQLYLTCRKRDLIKLQNSSLNKIIYHKYRYETNLENVLKNFQTIFDCICLPLYSVYTQWTLLQWILFSLGVRQQLTILLYKTSVYNI